MIKRKNILKIAIDSPAAAGAVTPGLPIDEYNKTVPPGWKEKTPGHPFRLYMATLRLWNRVTDVADDAKAALSVGRLKGQAHIVYVVRRC